jgi:Transposase
MAMPIVEAPRPVTGGIDTHLDAHVAAVVDVNGGVLAVESFPTTTAGFAELHGGLVGFGEMERVGVEGTGAYAAGLARHLRGCGLEVIEVDRPNRQARRRAGKSDPADAIEAARAVLAGRATGIAKTGDGPIEAMRSLLIAKRSGREARITCLNQIRHLGFCGPDDLREAFRGVPPNALAARAAGLRPRAGSDDVTYATKLAMRILGRRVLAIEADNTELDTLLADLVETTAAGLLAVQGSASTPPPSCSWPRVTIRSGSEARPRGRTGAVSHPCRHRQANSPAIDSTGAGTVKRTMRCGGSCLPGWHPIPAPASTSSAVSTKDAPSPRSPACSSATSPARSTGTCRAPEVRSGGPGPITA